MLFFSGASSGSLSSIFYFLTLLTVSGAGFFCAVLSCFSANGSSILSMSPYSSSLDKVSIHSAKEEDRTLLSRHFHRTNTLDHNSYRFKPQFQFGAKIRIKESSEALPGEYIDPVELNHLTIRRLLYCSFQNR